MNDSHIMQQFTVPVRVTVFQEHGRYIWRAWNGEESDMLFDSIDDARMDALEFFGA